MSVRMTHPTLPDREITVHEQSVPHFERAGWQLGEDASPDPVAGDQADDSDAGEAGLEGDEDA